MTTAVGTVTNAAGSSSTIPAALLELQTNVGTLETTVAEKIAAQINSLTTTLQGSGFDASTDMGTFVALSDAIAALPTTSSVSADLQSQFDTLTTNYGSAISSAVKEVALVPTLTEVEGDLTDSTLSTEEGVLWFVWGFQKRRLIAIRFSCT